jgi:hypothetical protein
VVDRRDGRVDPGGAAVLAHVRRGRHGAALHARAERGDGARVRRAAGAARVGRHAARDAQGRGARRHGGARRQRLRNALGDRRARALGGAARGRDAA